MITYENQCVGCPPERGCLGDTCPNRHVPVMECDCCKDYTDALYDFECQQICGSCLLKKYPKIKP